MTTAASADGDPVSVRQAERADLLAIARIERASFPQPWPFDAFERFLGETSFLVAEEPDPTPTEGAIDDGSVVGYIVADTVPNHGRPLGHVKDLAVHPDRRGEGIGSTLLANALGILEAMDASSVKLEVRESNEGAQQLYREFGFQLLRRIPRYYDDGEDAYVMVREL